jgi:hypothetical protein
MRFKRKRDNSAKSIEKREIKRQVFLRRYNNEVNAYICTDVEDRVVDFHFQVFKNYNSYLLQHFGDRKPVEDFTRNILSIGKIRWNFEKIHIKMQNIINLIRRNR